MTASNVIYSEAQRIVKLCGTRDPFKIAAELGIFVMFENGFTELKGMYKIIERNRFIFLNANLDELELKTICAHEIGHDRFHRDFAKSGALQDFMHHDMSLKPEREANIFAAELLINDTSILDAAQNGYSIDEIAADLHADVNLVLIKLDEMRMRGYEVSAPYRPRSDFLR